MKELVLNEDRLFSSDATQRTISRRLYKEVKDLPIVSPHGHTDPRWFADDEPFRDPASLLIVPDHYVYRMLYSQGIPLEKLGVPRRESTGDGRRSKAAALESEPVEQDGRKIWRLFAANWHLFRGTPTRMWFEHELYSVFGVREQISPESADRIYDRIAAFLASPAGKPRAMFEKFNIELLATTESPLDTLVHHQKLKASGWKGRVVTTYRPDPVVDPDYEGFAENVAELGSLTKLPSSSWSGYLAALRNRREYFRKFGATATDHGHPSARTANLSQSECEKLFALCLAGRMNADEADLFRGQMLTEMAKMSLEDGLVMQLHPGSCRNHNPTIFSRFGRDKGADIPSRTDYVNALKPLLDRFGNDPRLSLILFTLDETAYSRELAPLAGHYPILKLGPPWWFFDSPEGMRFFRERATETAGFYNTAGFNDDTRAFPSIPARHDVARRMDCVFLAKLVAEHRIDEEDARETAVDLAVRLARKAYKLQ